MTLVPSFFVVGAQKAGTTTLHDWLSQQPDVSLPSIKETHYFSHNERFRLGYDWYVSKFKRSPESGALLGEIDPEYMFFEEAAVRIRELNPNPKFVFLLRQPLERAFSQYLMSVRRGYEELPFDEALLSESERLRHSQNGHALNHQSYLGRSIYSNQIERFRALYPESEFLFIKFDDLVSQTEGALVYKRICDFIGVQSPSTLGWRNKKSNQASMPRSVLLRDFLWHGGALKQTLGRLVPSKDLKLRIAIWLDKFNQKPLSKNSMSTMPSIPSDIFETIRVEITIVERITGLECQDWVQRLEAVKNDDSE